MSSFEKLGVRSEIIQAIQEPALDWLLPTNVQDEAIPLILGGADTMVAAETGSGKTAAFAIPILQLAYEFLRGEGSTSERKESRRASKSQKDGPISMIKMSPHDKTNSFRIGEDGFSVFSQAGWQGGRATVGVVKGKYYFEMQVIEGLCRIGWSTKAGDLIIGRCQSSWGYGGTGVKSHASQWPAYGERYGNGDVIGAWIDASKGKMGFTKNGHDLGTAFEFSPSDNAMYPSIVVKNASVNVNFGDHPFVYPAPRGYAPLQSAKKGHTSLKFREQAQQKKSGGNSGNRGGGQPLALVLAPTRDLATQIHADFNQLSIFLAEPPVKTCLCIGGVSKMMKQVKEAHIIVGTCGMITGLIKSGSINLGKLKQFVIDEADRVLDKKQGDQDVVKAMYSRMPAGIQVMLFSATLHSQDITEMSKLITNHPQWVDLKGKEYVPDTVNHCVLAVDPTQDLRWHPKNHSVITDAVHRTDRMPHQVSAHTRLNNLQISEATKRLKPLIVKQIIDAFKIDQALIFCRTRLDCDNLESYLIQIGGGRKFGGRNSGGKENPYSCVVMHSGRRQYERNDNLSMFKEGDARFLICTDVAARGIDIKCLPFVINVTMPAESEDYIHRVGRVGRADHPGIAISILSKSKEKVWYHKCPSRGVGCTNTSLITHGGCCIWYDELEIFEQVEKRLNETIPMIHTQELVPEKMEGFLTKISNADPLTVEAQEKVESLRPRVEELSRLEVDAQQDWLFMTNRFDGMLA